MALQRVWTPWKQGGIVEYTKVPPNRIEMDMPYAIQQWPPEAVVAVVAGIFVLLVPRVLNYAVATYLLVVGILGLLHFWHGHAVRPQTVAALVAGILILVKPAILNYVVGGYLILIGILELGMLKF